MEDQLDSSEAAGYLGVAQKTLAKWRVAGTGPAFYKIGGLVRYNKQDLDRWMADQRRFSTHPTQRGVR